MSVFTDYETTYTHTWMLAINSKSSCCHISRV